MPALQRPLPEVGAEVIVEELPGFGFLALLQQSDDFDTVNVVLDGVSPTRSMQVKPSQVRTYEEALEEGWFPRWEFGHEKEGWRQYALDESYQLEAAYAAWRAKEPGAEDNVTIEGGGKMGSMQIIVAFGASSHFADWPHHAIQMNTASQHVRPVRRTFREASSVDADSKEGWCLSFGSLPVNVVCDVWNEVNDGQLEAAKALTTLQSIAYRKRIAELPEGDARLIARLRYSGPHVDAIAAERAAAGQPPLVAWGWFHGGELREWKAYRGAESRLLERQFQAKSKFVLMNGGKPSDGWPLKPLRVLLNVGWTTRGGRFFAPHVQVDLVSRRRRGVRRQEVSKGTWDYVFFYWLEKFPLLPASSVYGVYDSYLMKLHERGAADGHAALREEAEAELAELETECRPFVEPPHEGVPDEFLCPIGDTLMFAPAYQAQSPGTARMEREALVKWVRQRSTNPLTHESMTTADVVADDELAKRIAEWLRSFTGTEAGT